MTSGEDAMVAACRVSVNILRYLVDDRLPPRSDTLTTLWEEMKLRINMSDPATWLKYAPHTNLWVIMLGLAVSQDVQGRLSFLMNEKCVAMSIRAIRPAIHEKFWSCFRWMRQLIHARDAIWAGVMEAGITL